MSVALDVSRAPLGQLAAARLVAAVAAGDDRLERHYLEIKSELDLAKKTDLAKIAKFILGSANRMPDIAATAFEGYGVMVIGVASGEARGVKPVEVLDISKIVSQYTGASGPHWDVLRPRHERGRRRQATHRPSRPVARCGQRAKPPCDRSQPDFG